MARHWGRHSKGHAEEQESSLLTEHEWWLEENEPTRTINRRWHRDRPDGPHRRRSTDRPADEPLRLVDAPSTMEPEPAPPFDPSELFRERDARPDPAEIEGVEPWSVLGLTSEATWGDVVARQRELAKLHHPDRLGATGSDPAVEGRMAEINAAVAELARIYHATGDL